MILTQYIFPNLTSLNITNSSRLHVLGFESPGDGGGGIFTWDASGNKASANGGTVWDPGQTLANQGTGSGSGVWKRSYSGPIDAAWFGVKSSTNITTAFTRWAASLSGATGVIPPGNYALNSQLTLPGDCRAIRAYGATLDFSQATGTFPNLAGIYIAGGGLTLLPDFVGNLNYNTMSITFALAPSVSSRDVLVIYDSEDFSFSPRRNYYRKGEYVSVDTVSGSTITLQNSLYDTYASGSTTKIYKLSNPTKIKISGLNIVGNSSVLHAMKLEFGQEVLLKDMTAHVCSASTVYIARSYNFNVQNLTSSMLAPPVGTNYALSIGNSQDVRVSGCHLTSSRHAFSSGGGNALGSVPNRNIRVLHSSIYTTGFDEPILSADLHTNSEHCSFDSCFLNGAHISGNKNSVKNCEIVGMGPGIRIASASGGDFEFINNRLSSRIDSSYLRLIDCMNDTFNTECQYGGTIKISGNKFLISGASNTRRSINLFMNGCEADISLDISNNDFVHEGTPGSSEMGIYVFTNTASGEPFSTVNIHSNRSNTMLYVRSGKFIRFTDNTVIGSSSSGIRVSADRTGGTLIIRNNESINSAANGVQVDSLSDSLILDVAYIGPNTLINNNNNIYRRINTMYEVLSEPGIPISRSVITTRYITSFVAA